jgi:transposase-like protein
MESLFAEQELGFDIIGKSLAIKKTSDKNIVHLYKNGSFVKVQKLFPAVERRLFVVDLVDRQGATMTKLASSLGITRQSIKNWVDIYQKHGSTGLVNNTKDSWKKNPKRFTGNKVLDLQQERKEARQELKKQELTINFEPEAQVEEKHCGPANALYSEEFDYQENRYGGSMLYLSMIIGDLGFLKHLSSLIGSYLWVPLMFVMMHVNKIFSTEQLKIVYRKEFGQILGLKTLPHLSKVREEIWGLVDLKQATEGVTKFIKLQIIKGAVSIWRIFLDGHLVPYSGKEKVHKAHSTQRDMMMPGQSEFFAHDSSGNIVYFDIQEGKGDIVESLRQVSLRVKPYNGGTPPLVVVDRELWGVEVFLSLKGYRFVTWEKNCDKAKLRKLDNSCFTGKLTLNDKNYILFEQDKTYRSADKKSIKLRRIISRNTGTGETFAIVTNDKSENTKTIANSMLNRWGCSENGFKHMGTRTNMHYNPAWNIGAESQKQDICNPGYIDLKKKLKKKKWELTKIQKELGKKELKLKKDGKPRRSTVRDNWIKKRGKLEKEIRQINQEISECPERIDIRQTGGKTFKVIDTEAKKWWNISEMIFWNSRKKLAKLLYAYLPDHRDLLPVLDAITSSRGWMKSSKDTIVVRIEPLETPRFRDAQIQLCRYLNHQKIKLPNGKLLQYDVAENPFRVKK